MNSLQGRVALIVGSLNSIGGEIAELLVDSGAEVVCADENFVAGRALARQLGTAALFLQFQSEGLPEEQIRELVAKTLAAFGRIDMLVIPMEVP